MGLDITAIGITVVFLALIALSICIYLFGKLFSKNETTKKDIVRSTNTASASATTQPEPLVENYTSEEELIAVITAAIQASLGVRDDGKHIVVKSFRRLPSNSPIWNSTGRIEQLSNKLV